jgi:hypothetical protein
MARIVTLATRGSGRPRRSVTSAQAGVGDVAIDSALADHAQQRTVAGE